PRPHTLSLHDALPISGKQPPSTVSLVEIPDFFEAECFGIFGLAQHARITDAGQMAARNGLDAQQFGIQQHDFGDVVFAAREDLRSEEHTSELQSRENL